jgi:hypothetical protein
MKVRCATCDAMILPETAAARDGRCVPCARDGPPLAPIESFVPHRVRRFGVLNAQVMNNPFWFYMMGYAGPAYNAYPLVFGSRPKQSEREHPVWCWKRFGQTRTVLDEGEWNERVIYIGGEHEDSYDDDFCIYNDVVVVDRDVGATIYGYPREDFQPTDFHTATAVDSFIYIVGCLGYTDDRNVDRTPVYRLDTNTMRIDRIQTYGEKPGWIWKHEARYERETNSIVVEGGKRLVSKEPFADETVEAKYALDLNDNYWSIRTW